MTTIDIGTLRELCRRRTDSYTTRTDAMATRPIETSISN